MQINIIILNYIYCMLFKPMPDEQKPIEINVSKKFNKNLLGILRICLLLILINIKLSFLKISFSIPKTICHISFDLQILQHGLLCSFQPQRNKRSDSCLVLNYLVYSRLFWFACLLCFLVLDTHTRSQQQSQFFVYTQSSNNLQSYISPHRLRV